MKALTLFCLLLGAAQAAPSPVPTISLYKRLGETAGVKALAETFVQELSTDSRLMENAQLAALKSKVDQKQMSTRLSDLLCKAVGGPCKPNPNPIPGLDLKKIELGTMDWVYVAQDANTAMTKRKVPVADRGELLNLLWKGRASMSGGG
jgi:hypothetical protein